MRKPDQASELRLNELKREAEEKGIVGGAGVRPSGAPLPGYHGLPLLKPPVWTWEVPVYIVVGGTAGAAALLAFAGRIGKADARLIRHADWIALGGSIVSAPLLISDLGRPERFLNMLRVFKPQSPMSVGAWLLAGFSTSSAAVVMMPGSVRTLFSAAAAFTGLGMATYTGVLLGATAVPVWSRHASQLPLQFGASALASAAGLLELLGHRNRALHQIGRTAAGADGILHLQAGRSVTARVASALSGPVPFLIRLLYGGSRRARQAAAVASIAGSILTKASWFEAGRGLNEPRRSESATAGQEGIAGRAEQRTQSQAPP